MNTINTIYFKHRYKLFSLLALLILFAAVLNIYYVLEVNITSNDECLWVPKKINADSSAVYFKLVKINGVTWDAGIRNDDQLLRIDNIPIKTTMQAQTILNKFKSGQFADYTYLQNGKIINTKVLIKKLLNVGDLALSLFGLIWFLIGYIVLSSKPDGLIQKLFFAVGSATVLAGLQVILKTFSFAEVYAQQSLPFVVSISFFWSIGFSSLPILVIYFFWVFPKPFKLVEKNAVKILLVIVPVILFTLVIFYIYLTFVAQKVNFFAFQKLISLISMFIAISYVLGWISLIINYRRLKDKKEKRPILIVLIAFTIALIANVYTSTIAPTLADTIFNSPEYYTPIILIILIPLAFGYSIYKYQLMDVSIVVKNTITYGAATISLAGVYFFIIYVMGQSISKAIGTEYQGLIAGILFVVFAVIFQSTKDKFQEFITEKFYPEQFAYRKVLIKFSSDITTILGLDNILDSMTNTFVDGLKIKKFGIFLKDLKNGDLTLMKNVGIDNNDLKINSRNLSNYVKQKSLVTNNFVIDKDNFELVFPEIADKLSEEGIYTIIPMTMKSKIVGLVLFGLKHSGAQFAGKDLELLCATANQSAISIENARLYKSETEKLKIEKELDLARNIQQGLLPKCLPEVDGLDVYGEMIPASKIGGDYFDLIPVEGDRSKLYVIIGDVSGKGLPASLYMTKVQTMIQFSCTADKSPKEILSEINRKFYSSIERNSFITMSIGLFDYSKKTLTFCRAGHMPLYVSKFGEIKKYQNQGLGVGLDNGKLFEKTLTEEIIPIKSGESFTFFSDGITEAMNEKLELFEDSRLTSILNDHSYKSASDQV
ncbi:MAG: hypothetical protein CO128_06845, partial [Ignavibacteriales bacterium CG_4_9_14_3_um_filter_30_11]